MQIRLPRCIVPKDAKPVAIELPNFSDASTVGLGACANVQVVFADGVAKCSLRLVNQGKPLFNAFLFLV